MYWHAKLGCSKHYKATIKHIVNAYPPSYLVPPSLGEIFNSLEDSNCRLREYALAKDFNIIRNREGIVANSSYKFRYIFYNSVIKNNRKLKNYVEKDLKNKVINKH